MLTVQDANRQIEVRKSHEIKKDRQRVRQELDVAEVQKGVEQARSSRQMPEGVKILPVFFDGTSDRSLEGLGSY